MKYKYLYIYVIIFILSIVLLTEADRRFSETKPFVRYYIDTFPLPILGIYNTIIRLFHPKQTHIYNPNKFPTDKILKDNFDIIKQECIDIYKVKDNLMNFSDINKFIFYSDIDKDKWKAFPIKFYGKINDTARELCPNICKILDGCKDIHVAIISILEPGKVIRSHKGPCSIMLRYQLAIKIPSDNNNCWIKINNKKYYWEEGKSIIFDDTYVHEVHNDTNEPRIVLLIDIERPVGKIFKKINNFFLKYSKITNFIKDTNDNIEKLNENIIKK